MREFKYKNIDSIIVCTALPEQKKGIEENLKSICLSQQTSSDLGFLAAKKIITEKAIDLFDIGVLIFLSKTPDYRGPATAMVLQKRLGISNDCIVYDAPAGNGAFECGFNLGATLLNSIHKKIAIVVFGDTISKQLSKDDLLNLEFQDAATCLVLKKGHSTSSCSFATMTLSNYWDSFMIPSGGFRNDINFFDKLKFKRIGQKPQHLHLVANSLNFSLDSDLKKINSKLVTFANQLKNENFVILINLVTANLENNVKSSVQKYFNSDIIFLSHKLIKNSMSSTVPMMIEKIKDNYKKPILNIISISIGEGICLNISNFSLKTSNIFKTIHSDEFYNNGHVTHDM